MLRNSYSSDVRMRILSGERSDRGNAQTATPAEEESKWMQLFAEMKELHDITIEKCLTPPNAYGNPILCIFSDASVEAFRTCAYS